MSVDEKGRFKHKVGKYKVYLDWIKRRETEIERAEVMVGKNMWNCKQRCFGEMNRIRALTPQPLLLFPSLVAHPFLSFLFFLSFSSQIPWLGHTWKFSSRPLKKLRKNKDKQKNVQFNLILICLIDILLYLFDFI